MVIEKECRREMGANDMVVDWGPQSLSHADACALSNDRSSDITDLLAGL